MEYSCSRIIKYCGIMERFRKMMDWVEKKVPMWAGIIGVCGISIVIAGLLGTAGVLGTQTMYE